MILEQRSGGGICIDSVGIGVLEAVDTSAIRRDGFQVHMSLAMIVTDMYEVLESIRRRNCAEYS